jgi:hypothetical protein
MHRGKLVSKPIISVLLLHLNYSSLEDCWQKLIAWTQVLPKGFVKQGIRRISTLQQEGEEIEDSVSL